MEDIEYLCGTDSTCSTLPVMHRMTYNIVLAPHPSTISIGRCLLTWCNKVYNTKKLRLRLSIYNTPTRISWEGKNIVERDRKDYKELEKVTNNVVFN